MPLGEIAGEILGGLFRIVGQILLEVVLEIVIKGPGYLIVRAISKSEVNPDSWKVILTGILFWIVLGVSIYFSYNYFID